MSKEALSVEDTLKLALEALKDNQHLVADNERHAYVMEYNSIIEKCEEALMSFQDGAQPERTWVGLTDEEKQKIMWVFTQPNGLFKHFKYMEAVEAKLKEKNTRNGGCL